ncbi:Kinase [Hexamita inflata]|uniref:non-specific serine/threonine protein kinase n=1 Tax=Hexamita inflata TaxID=28002 RepID=A0AA86UJD0_9EUKA|nr:Kinase [Hexamita inflata]
MDECSESLLYCEKQTNIKYIVIKIRLHYESQNQNNWAFREVELLGKLSHNNIIKIYKSFTEGQDLYIVTDYTDSGDLSQLISVRAKANDPFTETEVMFYFVQILLALKHIHDNQIIHRDLRPKNILLTKIVTGNIQRHLVKLGGFHQAKMQELDLEQVGTPSYQSPEQLLENGYTNKSDIWSVGCVLYEMCTFCLPFSGQTLYALFTKVKNEKHESIDSKWFSKELSDIVDLLLSKDPEIRPSAKELLELPFVQKWITILVQKQMIDQENIETQNLRE